MTLDAPSAQLLSVFLGGVLAIASGIVVQWAILQQSRSAERRSLAGAFAGELAALLSVMKQRRYLDQIDALIAETERTGEVPRTAFSFRHHYFRVFDANAGRLGILDPPLPEMLAHHYIYSKVFLDDIEDLASKVEQLNPEATLIRLRATRDLLAEGLRRGPACLQEARRQAR